MKRHNVHGLFAFTGLTFFLVGFLCESDSALGHAFALLFMGNILAWIEGLS